MERDTQRRSTVCNFRCWIIEEEEERDVRLNYGSSEDSWLAVRAC